jgi:hypothetical protein
MTVKEELEKMWTEVVLACFKVLSHLLLKTMKNTKKSFIQDSFGAEKWIRDLPEYEVVVLAITLWLWLDC